MHCRQNQIIEGIYAFQNDEGKEFVYSGNSGLLLECNNRVRDFIAGNSGEDMELVKYLCSDTISKRFALTAGAVNKSHTLTLDFSYGGDVLFRQNDRKEDMSEKSFKTVEAGIEYFLKKFSCKNGVNISFLSSQFIPYFAPIKDFIESIAVIAAKHNIKLQFVLNTDTVLFSEEILRYVIENNFIIVMNISTDNYVKTGKLFDEYELYLMRENVGYITQYNSIFTKILLKDINIDFIKLYKELSGTGLDIISIQIADSRFYCENQYEDVRKSLQRFGGFFLENLKKGKVVKFPGYINIIKAIQNAFDNSISGFPCGAGISDFKLNLDGDIFLCSCHTVYSNHKLHNIYSPVENENILNFRTGHNVLQRSLQCSKCWAAYLCGGTCYYDLYDLTQLTANENQCFFKMEIIKNALYIYSSLNQQQRMVFDNMRGGVLWW